jgi:hypothetical protein
MTDNLPTIEDVQHAISAVAETLVNQDYAIIGAAALIGFGMDIRTTSDVDILVKCNHIGTTKEQLAQHPGFTLNKRTRHLTYKGTSGATVEIDVLNENTALIPFNDDFPIIITEEGAKLASATLLLNYKISTAYNRSSEAKKRTDCGDIVFLIQYHLENGMELAPGTCPNATFEAFMDLTRNRVPIDLEQWRFVGGLVE